MRGPFGPAGGTEFPGTAVVAGDTVVLTVRLAAPGNPHVIRAAVVTKRAEPGPAGRVTAQDFLPADPWTGVTQDWLTLGS